MHPVVDRRCRARGVAVIAEFVTMEAKLGMALDDIKGGGKSPKVKGRGTRQAKSSPYSTRKGKGKGKGKGGGRGDDRECNNCGKAGFCMFTFKSARSLTLLAAHTGWPHRPGLLQRRRRRRRPRVQQLWKGGSFAMF